MIYLFIYLFIVFIISVVLKVWGERPVIQHIRLNTLGEKKQQIQSHSKKKKKKKVHIMSS